MFLHLIVFILLIVLPAIVLYCFSYFSLLDCFKGCVAEMSCFSTLGSLGLRESREVNHTSFFSCCVENKTRHLS